MCWELTREEGRCSKPDERHVPCFLFGVKAGLLAILPAGITVSTIASASVARVLASAGGAVLLATRLLLLVTGLLCTGDQSLPLDMSTGRDTAVEMGQVLSPCLLPRAFLAGSFAEVLGRMTQRLRGLHMLLAVVLVGNVLEQASLVEGRSFAACSVKLGSCCKWALWPLVAGLYV